MKLKYGIMVMILVLLISCGKKSKQVVSWVPVEPKTGELLNIKYDFHAPKANLVDVSQLMLIGQFYFENGDSILVLPMKKNKNKWELEINLPASAYLFSFKFEDNLNRVDDNNGRGWNVIIRDNQNKIARNTHYTLGQIYLAKIRPEAFPYYKKAELEFTKELKLFPDNYKAWYELWVVQQNLNGKPNSKITAIIDSLLTVHPENPEILKLAFKTNLNILQNLSRAREFYTKLKNLSSPPKDFDEIVFSMLDGKNLQQRIVALEDFIKKYPRSKYRNIAYFRLGNYYLQNREPQKAKMMFERLNKVAPDDIANNLTLASIAINEKNYDRARQLLKNAQQYCKEMELRNKDPWVHPGKRLIKLNFNLCQIYSTRASLDFSAKDFTSAIKNRQKVIELGTPFPAFEWIGIGNAYLKMNKLTEASNAFIKALLINPEQTEAIQKLKNIYLNEHNSLEGFDAYLEQIVKKELNATSAPAPDFEALELNDNKVKLSDFKGKIIVIDFWNSWNSACVREIPQLNELVGEFTNKNNVEFWAISIEYKSVIKRFLEQQRFAYRQFYNGNAVKEKYNIVGFPSHIIIDADGNLRYKFVGFTPNIKQKLKQSINQLLKETEIS